MKSILLIASIVQLVFIAYAEKACILDFETNLENKNTELSKNNALIEEGVLKLSHIGKRCGSFKITNLPLKPFSVEYKVRISEDDPQIKDKHFSINFVSEEDKMLGIYSSGKNFFYILKENGKQIYYKGGGKNISFIDQKWKTITLTVMESYVELRCDGKLAFVAKAKLFPIKAIVFTVWHLSVEYDYIKITQLQDEKTDFLDKPALSASFENNADLTAFNGTQIKPSKNCPYLLKPGVSGKALSLESPRIEYNVDDIFRNKAGGIMFWFKPETDNFNRPLFRFKNNNDIDCLSIDANRRSLFVQFKRKDGSFAKYELPGSPYWYKSKHNWIHCAITWQDDAVKLFINGLPYSPFKATRIQKPLTQKDLEEIKKIAICNKARYDDLLFFRRPVTNQDVYNEYRSKMPVDLVMQKQVFDSDNKIKMSLQLAPGGYYMRPMPVESEFKKANVTLTATLKTRGKDEKEILSKTEKIRVDKPLDFHLPECKLQKGRYLLRVDVKTDSAQFTRCFDIDVCTPVAKLEPTNKNYEKGELIFEEKFINPKDPKYFVSGGLEKVNNNLTYLEAGSSRLDRFSFEVAFPKDVLGKPVLIEMQWPDDKPRMIGHYIYRPSKGYCDRDRLQQGIQSGIEYPLSNKMITTKYIFWPGFDTYLFEFRTMATNMPAAIANIKIYKIKDKLPALKINEPTGLPARKFGYMDEDQTFDTNLNRDWYDQHRDQYVNRDSFVFNELVKYLDYTGQNTFHYPLMRYWFNFYQAEGFLGSHLPPAKVGGINYMVDALGKHGVHFTVILNMSGIPEIANAPVVDRDYEKEGMFMGDKNGEYFKFFGVSKFPNFASHPEVARLYNMHILETAKILKESKNVDGFELWVNPWNRSLDYGYDDYNVKKFEKDTGIKIPEKNRYKFLTEEKRNEWIKWRAAKTTEFVRRIRETLDKVNPNWKLYYVIYDRGVEYHKNGGSFLPQDKDKALSKEKFYLDHYGVNINEINSIHNTSAVPMRWPTAARWNLHHSGTDSAMDDFNYSRKANENAYRKNAKACPLTNVFMIYFENMEMKKTQCPEKYSSFFQDADIKPYGRYWLKDLAFNIASMDALEQTIGAQPLGTLGREDEAREFAKAYRALPALSFKDVPGANDPVTVRFLETQNGTYFYLASMLYSPCKVKLKFSEEVEFKDLSSGKKFRGNDEIELNSYQLRSFLVPDQKVSIQEAKVSIPDSTKQFYAKRLNDLKEACRVLSKIYNTGLEKEKETISRVEKLLKEGQFAEAHRLIFSLEMRSFLKKANKSELVSKEVEMLKKGHVAVNCGSSDYYLAPGGKVFFPDQKFENGLKYGYVGINSKKAVRDIVGLKENKAPELFRTEIYDLDGYKLTVPNGMYKLRLYMRYGYKPNYKPGAAVFSVKAQGKTLFEKLDFYKANGGDFYKPVILEFDNIHVTDNLLNVDFITVPDDTTKWESTARHVVGIEAIKQ